MSGRLITWSAFTESSLRKLNQRGKGYGFVLLNVLASSGGQKQLRTFLHKGSNKQHILFIILIAKHSISV